MLFSPVVEKFSGLCLRVMLNTFDAEEKTLYFSLSLRGNLARDCT